MPIYFLLQTYLSFKFHTGRLILEGLKTLKNIELI